MGINNCNQITQNIPKQYINNNSIDLDKYQQDCQNQLYSWFDFSIHTNDTIDKDEIPTQEQLIMALCILSAIYPSS